MPETDQKPLISLRGASKRYGRVTALDGVSLDFREGEAVTIFGPNGAGKTTLLRIIAGLIRPTGGEIHIAGVDVTGGHHDEIRNRIGYISHQSFVYGQLTARENLMFFARLYGVPDPGGRADELLGDVGLSARADDVVQTFSRGMRQRLSIARALVNGPDIILLDEPFTGLDQHAADMLRKTLGRLAGEGKTVVMITHNIKAGLEMGARVLALVAGGVRLDRPAEGLDYASFHDVYFGVVGQAHY
ncbi:MAG: heme ABC exporter ATP-binding protein CcmA [Candidatus Nitrospinota bacterium M3_3B_026]